MSWIVTMPAVMSRKFGGSSRCSGDRLLDAEDSSVFEIVIFPLIAGVAGFALLDVLGLVGAVVFTISVGVVQTKLSANERWIAKLEKQIETLESNSNG